MKLMKYFHMTKFLAGFTRITFIIQSTIQHFLTSFMDKNDEDQMAEKFDWF